MLGCGDTPVNVVSLLVRLRGRGARLWETPRLSCYVFKMSLGLKALCAGGGNVTFLGIHIWLQSDAAFFYPRLDKYSLSVGMFCSTCGLSRRPPGCLATASSLAGNVS